MRKRLLQVLAIVLLLLVSLLLGYSEPVEAKPVPLIKITGENPIIVKEPEIIFVCYDESVPEVSVPVVDEEELELLAHLIFAEAGSDWCTDELQQYVGSVVLNRVASKYYPDNMYDVIYQKGQYSCTWNGMIDYEYNDRAYECAKFLLENGSMLPENVIFQAEFEQGDGTYKEIELTRGRKMYFCYKGDKTWD